MLGPLFLHHANWSCAWHEKPFQLPNEVWTFFKERNREKKWRQFWKSKKMWYIFSFSDQFWQSTFFSCQSYYSADLSPNLFLACLSLFSILDNTHFYQRLFSKGKKGKLELTSKTWSRKKKRVFFSHVLGSFFSSVECTNIFGWKEKVVTGFFCFFVAAALIISFPISAWRANDWRWRAEKENEKDLFVLKMHKKNTI